MPVRSWIINAFQLGFHGNLQHENKPSWGDLHVNKSHSILIFYLTAALNTTARLSFLNFLCAPVSKTKAATICLLSSEKHR